MNWRTTLDGSKRKRVIFALWPRACSDGITRWLEKVLIEEEMGGIEEFPGFGWLEISAHPLLKKPDPWVASEPYVYSYEFKNSKETQSEQPAVDYENAIVYRYDPTTMQHIPIGTYRKGKIDPTVALKLG